MGGTTAFLLFVALITATGMPSSAQAQTPSPAVQGPTGKDKDKKGDADNFNSPPFDFSDNFYAVNGIDVDKLNNSPTAMRFGFSPTGKPVRQTGAPAGPNQFNWVIDNSNTDPDRKNVRILATTGGYKDDTGSATQFISIIAFLADQSFFNQDNQDPNGVGNARGVRLEDIAGFPNNNAPGSSAFEAYAGLKQVGPDGVFRPTPCALIGDPAAVAAGNCFSVQSVATPNLRQDWRFSTNRNPVDGSAQFSYNGDNLLGLWIVTYHWYTAAGFGPSQTPDCKAALAYLAARNGLSLDGTPLIKTGAELHFVENNLQGNEASDFPSPPTNPCAAEGNLDPLGHDGGTVWLVCPSIPDPTRGGIAPDAFADIVRKQDGSPLDPQITASFNCLQKNGDFCALPNGTYMVKNQASGWFWDGSSPGGSAVQLDGLNTGAGAASQLWAYTANPDGTYRIINKASGLALADPRASKGSGTSLVQTRPTNDLDQRWIITPLNNGFRITNAASHLAIDATSATPAAGTSIVQATPTGDSEQVWVIH